MNLHLPQNEAAEAELRHLAAIPYQLISPASNSPIIGIFQDSLLGAYRITRDKLYFTRREAMNLLMMFSRVDIDKLLQYGDKIPSMELMSQIMPPLSMKQKTKLFDDGENYQTSNNVLEIRNGKYIRGQMEKGVLGSGTKGILHRVCNDFGNMACSNFIDDLQNIVTEYMKTSSYSVGISDLIADITTQNKIMDVITQQKKEVQILIDRVQLGIFENNTANTNNVEFEKQVNGILNKASEESGKIGRKNLDKNNRFVTIVKCGSKGSDLNISQMISCLGQQNVDGKRISYGFDSRTLPHFTKFDDSPGARGFVENSYIQGLTPPQLFFHAMGGRIGLIDTACKTSSTGYIQRRLIKAMEDLKIEYDMTVRNSKGKIIQFSYGGDGADTIKVENQHIPLTGMSLEDIYLHYDMMLEDKTSKLAYTKQTATRITKQMNETRKKCLEYIEQAIEDREELMRRVFKYKNDNEVKCPVAFHYIISNIQGQMHLGTNSLVDITPLEAFNLIEENLEKLQKIKYAQPTEMFIILYNFYLNPKDLLIIKRFNKKALIVLLEHINLAYKQALVNPGEMVGVIAGQSIGEPTTQMTLNSVTYETEIIVRDSTQQIHKLKIGDFVKNHIDKSQKKIYYDEKDTTYAELSSNEEYFEIPGSNEEGETVWNRIEAVTQHPVINKDGTNTMLKLTTKGQKEVIVTKAKSVLKLIDGKIQKADGETLKIDDYLVISRKPLEYKENNILNLYDILSPTKYIYGSEMDKARKLIHETHWWKKYSGKSFIIPYSRSDSARYVLDKTIDNSRVSNKEYLTGFVYTKNSGCSGTNKNDGSLPDIIDMDYDFGYLVGAYAAEGCMTKHQISISNNDIEYFEPIYRFCKKLNITTKLYSKQCGENDKWKSTDIRLYNTLLCNILENICGKLSHNKFLSPKIVFSNKECISGFLDAYIGGDGYITNRLNEINATSVSLQLLLDIQVMTRNIDIVGKIHKSKKSISNNIGTLPENIHQPYKLSFTQNQCYKMANMLNLLITNKQERILKLRVKKFRYNISKHDDKIFPNEINGIINYEERKGKMEDLLFEKIVKIEEVNNTTNYAYDLTVENTRNFDTYTGINLDDTFHFSGISSKSNVTRGVPRIEEILRLTKNPKHPSLTVFMKPTEEQSKEKSIHYTHMLEHTKIGDLVKTVQICFDPNPRNTIINDDKDWLSQFYEFEDIIKDCEGRNYEENTKSSKWIIRLELDAETMLDKNITMDDIHYALTNYSNDIECAFTDYNADNLVFRIRLNNNLITKNKKKASTFTLDQTDELYLLNAFQDDLLNKIVLRGIPGITKVMPRKLQGYTVYEDGKYVVKDKWVLDTTGSNLMHVLSLDYIDTTRTYSNDIKEIQNVLGIEATRQIIYNELLEVIEFSGSYVNSHHLHLLADRMTSTKKLVPVFRSGILNDDIGPIAKATFEVHTEEFLSAARHGMFDHMRGISANVMTGQNGYYGTSAFQLVLDMKEIQQNVKPSVINKKETTDQEISLDGLIRDFNKIEIDKCSLEQIRITNNIQHIKQIDLGDIECSNNDEFVGF